jgi:hypothetical protein
MDTMIATVRAPRGAKQHVAVHRVGATVGRAHALSNRRAPHHPPSAQVQVDAGEQYSERNPLWVVVIGMVCLFGTMALALALG